MGNKVIGYGEDALTYWALTTKLKEVLQELGDSSKPAKTLLFYRPSFGRGRNCFGEFDAILGTPNAVYLIESKWQGSAEYNRASHLISIECVQKQRHRIFRWYLTQWRNSVGVSWAEFREKYSNRFTKRFEDKSIPHGKSNLAKSLQEVLGQLADFDGPVTDVCLFFKSSETDPTPTVKPSHFQCVEMFYNPQGESKFFEMS